MPVYEVTKTGLIKGNSIHEYAIGEKFSTTAPIKDASILSRVRVLSGAAQKEFAEQIDQGAATIDEAEQFDQGAATSDVVEDAAVEEPTVIEVEFNPETASIEDLKLKAKELGIKGAHLYAEEKLRQTVATYMN